MPATVYTWKHIPVLRLLLPLIAGILVQWYGQIPPFYALATLCFSLLLLFAYQLLAVRWKYQLARFNGIFINLALISIGALLVSAKDVRKDKDWFGHQSLNDQITILSLEEPLVEKQQSYKALASVHTVVSNGKRKEVKGKVLIYFKKDSTSKKLSYGSVIAVNAQIDLIKNSGNPGAFDYNQYCLMQGITHQAYLNEHSYVVLPTTNTTPYRSFIYASREKIVAILKQYIREPKEAGLAEALLIGYKDDLDKNLVESYSNTGVVHVIAISGLHLGIIYSLLLWLTKALRSSNQKWLRFLIVFIGLWLFSLLAGAQPSVLRSAVMFSCLALGEVINRRSNSYNTLLFSALLLICINPFTLWDVGFQLSYSAVLSIIVFYKPIFNLVYVPNKWINKIWQLIAVTLAAQILTTPISLYHFHQFPLLFLPANLVAVPLSFLILYAEIIVVSTSFIEPIAVFFGHITEGLLWCLNQYIELLDSVEFAIWKGISLSIIQTTCLLSCVAALAYFLIEKQKKALWIAMGCIGIFFLIRSYNFLNAYEQKEMIVYNVPNHQAIDLIEGRQYCFLGDSLLLQDAFLRNFHLQPSRVLHRISPLSTWQHKSFLFGNKHVLVIDSTVHLSPLKKIPLDVLVLSKNPKLYMKDIAATFAVKQIIIDASVPNWKKKLWIKDCDSLRLSYYDVSQKGAFVMKVQ